MQPTAGIRIYAGVFCIALATLMYEILLTRIFSFTTWYHFAFMVVSLAMFGMTMGAVHVYLRKEQFGSESIPTQLWLNSLLFSLSMAISFVAYVPVSSLLSGSMVGAIALSYTYVLFSLPFFFAGICICVALTKFPSQNGQLYAMDLCGAALGCLAAIAVLSFVDAPTAVIVTAALAAAGSCFFAGDCNRLSTVIWSRVAFAAFALLAVIHGGLVQMHMPRLYLQTSKEPARIDTIYEKWNAISYVRLQSVDAGSSFIWSRSSKCSLGKDARYLWLTIDGAAGTALTEFTGDWRQLEFLKCDVTSIVHQIKHNADVVVIGVGGGRDILTALLCNQKSVLGIEINQDVLNILTNVYGDFAGHLERDPRVTLVVDEARSFIERSSRHFDIIQASLIDTWAATSAGAYTLSENALYTVEGWNLLLNHLNDDGILSFSRWYLPGTPEEMYRVCSLAAECLRQAGVREPRKHVIILAQMSGEVGVATILVSKQPFTEKQVDEAEQLASKMNFLVLLTPRSAVDEGFVKILMPESRQAFIAGFPFNISAPRDDSPFFFNMVRMKGIFDVQMEGRGTGNPGYAAAGMLRSLLLIVLLLTMACIVFPLWITRRQIDMKSANPLLIYFLCIGLGFMLVEVSMMQKLTIFLGHPTMGLSVVLFVLLVSGGLGSYITSYTTLAHFSGFRKSIILILPLVLLLAGLGSNNLGMFAATSLPVRVLVSSGLLFAMGLFMGMAFPLGMKMAEKYAQHLTPWLWGVNGAASVCASVLAVVIALSWGINAAMLSGVACYLLAALAFICMATKRIQSAA